MIKEGEGFKLKFLAHLRFKIMEYRIHHSIFFKFTIKLELVVKKFPFFLTELLTTCLTRGLECNRNRECQENTSLFGNCFQNNFLFLKT